MSRSTVHRRFGERTRTGLWVRLHQQFLYRLAVVSELDWSRVIVSGTARPGPSAPAKTSGGTRLANFYGENRVLDNDPFHVKVLM